MFYKSDETTKWLDPFDAFFSVNLLIANGDGVCEVGVYKGGFLITVLRNHPKLNALGIDPYPQQSEIREIFLENIKLYEMTTRVQLLSNYTSISQRNYDLIHIDGEHSEVAVLNNLKFAMLNLAEKGIIVIDDIWHPLFPGVISATMKFVHEYSFVPFLTTRSKMYLCREVEHEFFYQRALGLIRDAKIEYSGGLMQGDEIAGVPATYTQSNAIKGYRQIVVPQKTKFEQLVTLGLIHRPSSSKTKRIIRNLMPPMAVSVIQKFLDKK